MRFTDGGGDVLAGLGDDPAAWTAMASESSKGLLGGDSDLGASVVVNSGDAVPAA